MMRFEVYPARRLFRREWRFRIVAANGEIVASGEGYANRQDCLATCAAIRGVNKFAIEINQGA